MCPLFVIAVVVVVAVMGFSLFSRGSKSSIDAGGSPGGRSAGSLLLQLGVVDCHHRVKAEDGGRREREGVVGWLNGVIAVGVSVVGAGLYPTTIPRGTWFTGNILLAVDCCIVWEEFCKSPTRVSHSYSLRPAAQTKEPDKITGGCVP